MAPEPLRILRKGLDIFKKSIKNRKEILDTRLAENRSISSSDERWLDNEANTIDEEHVIELLENASDYERGVGRLDEKAKSIVKKLREWAGYLVKVASKK